MQINPSLPCSTAYDYFTAEEKKHLNEFEAADIRAEFIYTNAAGEQRIVRGVALPYGWQNAETIYGQHIQKDSPYRYYHTPCASVHQHREAEIWFDVKGEKQRKEPSGLFLKWLGRDYTVTPIPVKEDKTIVPMAAIKAQEAGMTEFAEIDKARAEDKEEKPDWTPVKKRKDASRKF